MTVSEKKVLFIEERNIKNNSSVFPVCICLSAYILIWEDFFNLFFFRAVKPLEFWPYSYLIPWLSTDGVFHHRYIQTGLLEARLEITNNFSQTTKPLPIGHSFWSVLTCAVFEPDPGVKGSAISYLIDWEYAAIFIF